MTDQTPSCEAGQAPAAKQKTRRSSGGRPGGHTGLTPREIQVWKLLAEGYSNTAIAERLVMHRKSVENYAHLIFQKLGVGQDEGTNPRTKAALMYHRIDPAASVFTALLEAASELRDARLRLRQAEEAYAAAQRELEEYISAADEADLNASVKA